MNPMLTLREVEAHFAHLPPNLLEVVLELRNLAAQAAPGACEELRRGGAVYFHAGGGPVSAGICGIQARRDHIRLYFTHGAFLPDPFRLLTDEGRKAMRCARIDSYETAPWDALRALIEAHARFDPRTQTFWGRVSYPVGDSCMPETTLEEFLAPCSPPIRELTLAARTLILRVFPDALEMVDVPSKIIAYGRGRKYADLVFALAPFNAHVNLMFARGASLPDPAGLLQGSGKRARHVRLTSLADLRQPDLLALLEAALKP